MDPSDGDLHRVTHEDFKKQWTGVMVLIAPGERFKILNEKANLGSRLLQLVRGSKDILIQSLVGALYTPFLGLSLSLYVGRLVDNVIPGNNINLLNLLGVSMLIIILFRFFLIVFQSVFVLKTGQRIDATLILGYYQQLLKLPKSFFDNMRTGEIISRIGDAVKIRVFVNDVSISLVLNIFILIVSFCFDVCFLLEIDIDYLIRYSILLCHLLCFKQD